MFKASGFRNRSSRNESKQIGLAQHDIRSVCTDDTKRPFTEYFDSVNGRTSTKR